MHSKWQLWDFFQSFPKGSWAALQGRVVLQAFDPLALRLMKDHLLSGIATDARPKQVSGSDTQASWVEDQFLSLGLFGNTESWIINAPDDVPTTAKDVFLRDDLMLDGRVLAFGFHNDSAFMKKLLKAENVSHLQIEAPRFWETAKLVDFLCAFFQLPLAADAKQYLLQAVENEFMPLFDAFRLVKLNHPESRSIGVADVRALIGVDRLDQFALANDMGKKAWRPFFERLLSVETDFERWRGIFAFLQSHLMKIADPSYADGKGRLSKYDQDIITLAKGWKPEEARDLLLQIQAWELACRTKDPFLPTHLRQALLKAHKGAWVPAKLSAV